MRKYLIRDLKNEWIFIRKIGEWSDVFGIRISVCKGMKVGKSMICLRCSIV